MGAFRLPSGALASTDHDVAKHVLETHFPGFPIQPISGSQSQSQTITPSTEDWVIASSVITEVEIRWTVNGFSSYKTARDKEFFPGLLQQGIETLVVPLCKILTACLAFGYVPKHFQKVRVIFTPKPEGVAHMNWRNHSDPSV
jgi:hypothetical protein